MDNQAIRKPTAVAVIACAEWLKYCRKIGWPKSDLDQLQDLWWQYHDDDGCLKSPNACARAPGAGWTTKRSDPEEDPAFVVRSAAGGSPALPNGDQQCP